MLLFQMNKKSKTAGIIPTDASFRGDITGCNGKVAEYTLKLKTKAKSFYQSGVVTCSGSECCRTVRRDLLYIYWLFIQVSILAGRSHQ